MMWVTSSPPMMTRCLISATSEEGSGSDLPNEEVITTTPSSSPPAAGEGGAAATYYRGVEGRRRDASEESGSDSRELRLSLLLLRCQLSITLAAVGGRSYREPVGELRLSFYARCGKESGPKGRAPFTPRARCSMFSVLLRGLSAARSELRMFLYDKYCSFQEDDSNGRLGGEIG